MHRPLLAALTMGLAAGGAAAAEPIPAPVPEEQRRACRDDAFRLCPGQVALMRREAVRTCLKAKADQLSPLCRSAFSSLGAPSPTNVGVQP